MIADFDDRDGVIHGGHRRDRRRRRSSRAHFPQTFWPNVLGMWICGAGVLMVPLGDGAAWWSLSAGIAGFGMALLYPNLGAAVADITPPAWRGSAIGIYRFWRDLGYGIGALGLGLVAHLTGVIEAAFWFVGLSMFASGAVLFFWSEETHPRLNPAIRPG